MPSSSSCTQGLPYPRTACHTASIAPSACRGETGQQPCAQSRSAVTVQYDDYLLMRYRRDARATSRIGHSGAQRSLHSMHHSLIIITIVLLTSLAPGQMVLNDAISNDPAKEGLCALRAKHALGTFDAVPFEIDSGYVARMRSLNPDATFVAMDGITPQLVECYLSPRTGRYEPVFLVLSKAFGI